MIFWILFLFVAGIGLILLEFILPGGICAVAGGVLLLVSTGLGIYTYPESWFLIILAEVFATSVCVFAGVLLLPRIGVANHLVLGKTQFNDEGYVSDLSHAEWMGLLGEAYTPLRPSGTVILRGDRVGAVSNGDYIEEGAMIRVVEVHGNRVVVERAMETASAEK